MMEYTLIKDFMNSDYQEEVKQQIDDTDYGYINLLALPFEVLLEKYIDYRNSNIWTPPAPFKDTFSYIQYGVKLKMELQKRDMRGSKIL